MMSETAKAVKRLLMVMRYFTFSFVSFFSLIYLRDFLKSWIWAVLGGC